MLTVVNFSSTVVRAAAKAVSDLVDIALTAAFNFSPITYRVCRKRAGLW